MIHIDKINAILDYIEESLDKKIDLNLLAKKSALSKYHFHRIFKALVGEQPLKYVEKRRLTRAAFELLNTNRSIIDIAFDFGFGSHESFTRVFKKRYLTSPSQYRKKRPNIQFQDTFKIGHLDLKLTHGKANPNPIILHKPTFSISGVTYKGYDTEIVNRLWEKFWQLQKTGIVKVNRSQYLGACFHDMDVNGIEVFEYYAGYETELSIDTPDSMKTVNVPENDYALFTHKGSIDQIELTYDLIYGTWLPYSEYKPVMDLDIIVVDSRFSGQNGNSEVDILVPIRRLKKQELSRTSL